MKKLFSSLFAIMASAFLFTGTASAQCSGDTCMDTSTPDLEMTLLVDVTTYGGLAGIGLVQGVGDDFVGRVDKESELSLDTELDVDYDGCQRDCGDIDLSFEGKALESITTLGIAVGSTPGQAVSVENASQALTNIGLEVNIGGTDSSVGDGS